MEENKKTKEIKIGLKTFIKFIILIAIIIIIAVLVMTQNKNNENSEDYEKVSIMGTTYYHRLTSSTWSGEYHQYNYGYILGMMKVMSYDDYLSYIYELNIENYYTDENSNYIILTYSGGYGCEMDLIDCIENDDKIIIYGDEDEGNWNFAYEGGIIVIPTDMPVRNGNRI